MLNYQPVLRGGLELVKVAVMFCVLLAAQLCLLCGQVRAENDAGESNRVWQTMDEGGSGDGQKDSLGHDIPRNKFSSPRKFHAMNERCAINVRSGRDPLSMTPRLAFNATDAARRR